ncbi:acyltransferase family protein [Roseimaritima sediminicola]|uniref:acyltransferase family protein n=1 Tax=Roseimaritima sediminicola TaxID=2662066 RepID=UPI00129829B2|nr:acyltransferase [Roseimaritima sediminicola]
MPLSDQLQKTFRLAALMATVLVVLIHYRSADTLGHDLQGGGLQGWGQEWLVNGVARVAVPLFALAAGCFYFVSFSGSLRDYLQKLSKRVRTVAVPYLLMSTLAVFSWLALRYATATPVEADAAQLATRLLLHPMAEQLWFLRDLMVLVSIAPLLGFFVARWPAVFLGGLSLLWMTETQPAPIIAGWYLVNNETLLFFCLGACLARQPAVLGRLERLTRCSAPLAGGLVGLWMGVLAARMVIAPEFDLWYVQDYTATGLILQKVGIAIGCVAVLATGGCAARHAAPQGWWMRLSSDSFFVYLIHEFPLREALERAGGMVVPVAWRFWLVAPLAILLSFAAAEAASRWTPTLVAVLTGGRIPGRVPPSSPALAGGR